ncbi:acetyl/propionyl/methylcrotonyl-CoA carboxylase subunit alpha [Ferrovibrio sp.]|uniref:acetyl-CoA carboxylase biotin carboxylase subunit n=1 Tax=Ferrovibrio sp. TaxID=1917215 RepID=UPI0035AD94B3
MSAFRTVLVANRGEIACRVIRTLKRLNIRSVAVYHHDDRAAPHVALADIAVPLQGAVPTAAYLDTAQIIAVCKAQNVDAVHPGYGFLSENAGFVAALNDAGIAFIGPDAESMHLMGDKIRSRDFARANGVPVAPSIEIGADATGLAEAAKALGYPLLIKASAGGGGKGMKVVRNAAELAEAASAARGEAQRYFGDGRIYAERLIERPRHIEVQVLGDGQGNVLHFGERECSLQRRYQKIVEEAPAPNLPENLRDAICEAGRRLAAAARYRNAGTVEFILAPDGAFYFLEMNTRLQVEHPVTEMVYGIDLVECQIRIAEDAGLPFAQADLHRQGHAIEVRLCAEEPERDFRPAIGKVGLLREPQGPGLRFDGGIREGQMITPAFDSMLAKVIAHGAHRNEAAMRLRQGLLDMALLGVSNNSDYLARILAHPEFLAGKLHTGFLVEQAESLQVPPLNAEALAIASAAAALGQADTRRLLLDVPEPHASIGFWRN